MTLIVCSLADLPRVVAQRRPSHVLTLLGPEQMIAPLPGFAPERHLRLTLNDIHEPVAGMVLADEDMVARLLAFGAGWDGAAPLVAHCFAGVSRSSAAALAIACQRHPAVPELEIALSLRAAAPHIFPNRRIAALADAQLGRRGRLVAAVQAMGPDDLTAPHCPVDLPLPTGAPTP